MDEKVQRFQLPADSHHRRPDKIAKKYYLSPDVVALIEAEARRTSYPRNIVIEMLVRRSFGTPPVEEAVTVAAPKPKRERVKAEPKRRVDLGI
jgi:hypothetical protein